MDGLEQADDLYFDVRRQVKMKRWSRGRGVLTGDAAWCATPLSGIGTTLAIVGAYVLAGELSTNEDREQALERYEVVMRPFVEQGQGVPKIGPRLNHPRSKLGISVHRTVLGVLSKPGIRDLLTKVTMQGAEKIELPTYHFD